MALLRLKNIVFPVFLKIEEVDFNRWLKLQSTDYRIGVSLVSLLTMLVKMKDWGFRYFSEVQRSYE